MNDRTGERMSQSGGDIKRLAEEFISGKDIDPERLLGYDGEIRNFIENNKESQKGDTANHQLRKFYDDIVEMSEVAKKTSGNPNDPSNSANKIRLAMMEARLNYARERRVLSKEIFELLKSCVHTVNTQSAEKWADSLDRFKTLFEAIVAYSYKGGE